MKNNEYFAHCNVPFDCRIVDKNDNTLAYLNYMGMNAGYDEYNDSTYIICDNTNELAFALAKFCVDNKLWDCE